MNETLLNKRRSIIYRQLLITVLLILFFCIGRSISINSNIIQETSIDELVSNMMGVNKSNITLFSLGVAPLIMTNIVVSILINIIPDLKNQYERNDKKLINILKFGTCVFYTYLQASSITYDKLTLIILMIGSFITYYIAYLIDNIGIGHGTSTILAVSIIYDAILRLKDDVSSNILYLILLSLICYLYCSKAYVFIPVKKNNYEKKKYKLFLNDISITPVFYSYFILFILESIKLNNIIKINLDILMIFMILMFSIMISYNNEIKKNTGNILINNGYIISEKTKIQESLNVIKIATFIRGILNGLIIIGLMLIGILSDNLLVNPLSLIIATDFILLFFRKVKESSMLIK